MSTSMGFCAVSDADRRVFALAWPGIISELSTPLLGIVDTVVVGHLHDAADLSGIALAVAIYNPLMFVFNFLRMGTGGVTAQAFGANDGLELLASVARGIVIGLAVGLVLLMLQGPLVSAGFLLVQPPDAATMSRAQTYFHARIFGAPAALANFAVSAWLIGVQRPGCALATNLVLNLSNALLCVLFAWVLGFGVGGVGSATAIANYIALAFGALQVVRVSRQVQCVVEMPADKAITWSVVFDKRKLLELVHLNGNIFLRSLFLMVLITDFTALSAHLGRIPLAANNLLSQLQMLISYGADGFADAMGAMVGDAVGLGDKHQVRVVVVAGMRWAGLLALGYTLAYVFFGRLILNALTSHSDVVQYAVDYLPWQWTAPLLSVTAYMMDGVFVGATRPREMRNATLLALLAFVVIGHCWQGSNDVLWVAYLTHLVVRAAVLLCCYPRVERSAEVGMKQALLDSGGCSGI
mmetsp:Transcript_89315/g.251414  ORF Transcript_89315/g.251414 Transcript_89315/m.251414 type:complete len:467 (-) Transcript_89315:245-1645(-)